MVGNAGAGKSTFARRLAARLGLAYVELDAVFWAEGWTQRDQADAMARLRAHLDTSPEGWVADGNWNRRLEGALDDADIVVWLDYPRRVVMPRIVRRTLARGLTRRELWHGNREQLHRILSRDPEANIVRWSWTQHEAYRARYAELARTGAPVVRLRSPREARAWAAGLLRG